MRASNFTCVTSLPVKNEKCRFLKFKTRVTGTISPRKEFPLVKRCVLVPSTGVPNGVPIRLIAAKISRVEVISCTFFGAEKRLSPRFSENRDFHPFPFVWRKSVLHVKVVFFDALSPRKTRLSKFLLSKKLRAKNCKNTKIASHGRQFAARTFSFSG